MRGSIVVVMAGLVVAAVGCPKKTPTQKTNPFEGMEDKSGDEDTSSKTSKTGQTPVKPKKPAYTPPASRNFTLNLKVRTEAGETSHVQDMTLVRTPVTQTRRVSYTLGGWPKGRTQKLELEVASGEVVNGTDAGLLGFFQQVIKEGRRLIVPKGGRVIYLPHGGLIQQKHEKPSDVKDTYTFAGRVCHGKRLKAVNRGWLAGGEPFKGRVNLELWRDPETAEVLALRGTATYEFRDQGRMKLTYRIEAADGSPGASGAGSTDLLQQFETDEQRSRAMVVLGAMGTAAAVATGLQKDPGGWLPAAMLASAISGSGLLHGDAGRPTLSKGRVEGKRADPARKLLMYLPETKPNASGTMVTRLVPSVVTDDADHFVRFGDGDASRVVRVTKAEHDRARTGDPFDVSSAKVEAQDLPLVRAATAEEAAKLAADRKAGKAFSVIE